MQGRRGKSIVFLVLTILLAATMPIASPIRKTVKHDSDDQPTTTPIKHVVVIFQENVSFDHYFATYPNATNPSGEPKFVAAPGTPSVNGLTQQLIDNNPNLTKPFRFDRSQAATCDQNHDYTAEQQAFHAGLMDLFVQTVGTGPGNDGPLICNASDVMGYFDGNTVTALWNYAQHYSMSDNSFDTEFGPSTPGAVNLVSGQTHGVDTPDIPDEVVKGTLIGDLDPRFDVCSGAGKVGMTGRNVGDLLNDKGITWGFFEGGFSNCALSHTGSDGKPKKDYIPHHQPFQYYQSTANPNHLPPSSVANIGKTDQANHQYDITDFWNALNGDNLPSVSFLKAPAFQDGHAGYSDPLAEQTFLVQTINKLQQSDEWKEMAVIILYDDSDGWYDHVMGPIISQSNTVSDALSGLGQCGMAQPGQFQGRCGYGPRQPLLVISPFAKSNSVDHTTTDQTSVLKFIEDNWSLGRIGNQSFDDKAGSLANLFDFSSHGSRRLILDPTTGLVVHDEDHDHDH
jgi:phospholipase C